MTDTLNNEHSFLTVLEVGKTKIKVLEVPWLVRARFLIRGWQSSHCELTWWMDPLSVLFLSGH